VNGNSELIAAQLYYKWRVGIRWQDHVSSGRLRCVVSMSLAGIDRPSQKNLIVHEALFSNAKYESASSGQVGRQVMCAARPQLS